MKQARYLISALFIMAVVVMTSCSAQTATTPTAQPASTQQPASTAEPASTKAAAVDSSTPIRIGMVHPLSGSLAQIGQEAAFGSRVAVDLINEAGGIDGRKVELVEADAPTPDQAKAAVERLITRDGLKIIMGTYGSSNAIAAASTAQRYGAFYWETSSASYGIIQNSLPYSVKTPWGNYEMAFRVADSIEKVIAPALNTPAKDLRIAYMFEDSAFGSELADYVDVEMKKLGLNVVLAEPYNAAKTTDFTSLILKLKQANPDVLVSTAYIGDATLFQQQAKKQDFYVKVHLGTTAGHGMSAFAASLGKSSDGILVADSTLFVNPEGLTAEAAKVTDEAIKRFEAEMGHEPASHTGYALSGAYGLLRYVIPQAKSLEPADLLESAMAVDLPFGSLPMGYGLKITPSSLTDRPQYNERGLVVLCQWQGGKLVPVYPSQFATGEMTSLPLPQWSDR